MSAYVTKRSLARQALRRKSCMPMIAQTTNPRRFMLWLSIAFWGFLLLSGSVLFVIAFLGLFFGVQF